MQRRSSYVREPFREPQSASANVLSAESYDDIINTIQQYKENKIKVETLVGALHTKKLMSNNVHATLSNLKELLIKHRILDTVKKAEKEADTTEKLFQDGGNRRKIKRRTRRSTYRKLRRSTIRRR